MKPTNIEKLINTVVWIIVIIFIGFIIFRGTSVYSQVIFTEAELIKIAEHNLSRKKCEALNVSLNSEIDSMNLKTSILGFQLQLKDSTIISYKTIVQNYKTIDTIRVEEKKLLTDLNKDQQKTIKKQNRRLNFWRIFTPVTVTAAAIFILLK